MPITKRRVPANAVLAICCLSLLIVGMDVTIVNVALPSLLRDLDTDVTGVQWVSVGYTVAFASFLMFGGSLGDRMGRAKVFRFGLALFTLASLGCSLAPSVGWLVAARVVQGFGASMLNPVAVGIIRNTFEDPAARARAIGVWGAVVGISMALGPVFGGLLTTISWRAVFLVNIPIGIVAIILTTLFIPESKSESTRRWDPVGQVLVIVALSTLMATILEGPNLGWDSPAIIALFVVACAAGAMLVRYELNRREPLIDPRFFASRPFSAASATAVVAFTTFGAFLFVSNLYLQDVRELSAIDAGLAVLPMAAMTALASPVSGRIVGVRGVRLPLLVAGTSMGVACLMLLAVTSTTPIGWILVAFAIFGLGFGMVNAPITTTAIEGMPAAQASAAAAVTSTSRQVGQSLGVAIGGTIIASAAGSSTGARVMAAGDSIWLLLAGLCTIVCALAIAASTQEARQSAVRTADRFHALSRP